MTEVEELAVRIRNLPKEECSKLREWFYQWIWIGSHAEYDRFIG